ncbi:NAD(P)/FAD-dependent oxidoreductase [Jatrophihabitans fulvus]
MQRIVVVGGSVAGVNAVEGLRARAFDGDVTLVSSEPELPYDKPPLSKAALREGPDLAALELRPKSWYDEQGVRLRLGLRAAALDMAHRRIVLEGGDVIGYDGLVIATGCAPRVVPALEGAPVHVLRTIGDAAALHAELVAGRHLVVLGAGFIGLEVAASARALGLDVTVVELAPVPLKRVLGDESGRWFVDLHAERGVDLRCGTSVTHLATTARGTRLTLSDGSVLDADLVVAGVGVTPAVGWLAGSGIDTADGVLCDAFLRTSAPDVVAAGDVVRWPNELFGESMRVEQWLNAVDQGRHAAATLLGEREPFRPVPYFWSDQFDAMVRFVGRADAADTTRVQRVSDRATVALYGRGGVLRGALCINAPRHLARLKRGIQDRVPFADALDTVS